MFSSRVGFFVLFVHCSIFYFVVCSIDIRVSYVSYSYAIFIRRYLYMFPRATSVNLTNKPQLLAFTEESSSTAVFKLMRNLLPFLIAVDEENKFSPKNAIKRRSFGWRKSKNYWRLWTNP